MKVLEIKKVNNKRVIVVEEGKKNFKRISWDNGKKYQWRRFKTNHLVKKNEIEFLEKNFNIVNGKTVNEVPFPTSYSGTASVDFTVRNGVSIGVASNSETYPKGTIKSRSEWNNLINSTSGFSIKKMHNINREVLKLMKDGRKLQAVKLIKENTSWGLKDSKEYYEHLELLERINR